MEEDQSRELRRVPASVFAALAPGTLRLTLFPGLGMADGGIPLDVPVEDIPPDLRMPNTLLWLELNEHSQKVRVWRRVEEEGSAPRSPGD
jgi:hypothetical protein